jgi:hypothetical protein
VLENYTVNAFLERQPEGGLHHICYVVDDLKAICGRLRAREPAYLVRASRSSAQRSSNLFRPANRSRHPDRA